MQVAWGGAAPLDLPDRIEVLAVFPRPEGRICRHKRSCQCDRGRLVHRAKPDGDNLLKAVGDALVAAGVIRDDCRVPEWSVRKIVAAENEGPALTVSLEWETP